VDHVARREWITRGAPPKVSGAQLDFWLGQLRGAAQSEELAKANGELEKTAKENAGAPERSKPPRQPPVRRPPPADLRRVDNVLAVPASERPCPKCGKERACIGHDVTEVIDLIPAEVIVRLDRREVLACKPCEGELARGPMGDKVVAGGVYGSRLVATLVVDKYEDDLPLHRQAERLERLGLSMPSSSMADQVTWATELLSPVYRHLLADVLSARVMHLDATSLPVLNRDHPDGKTVGSLWGYVGDTSRAVFLYTSTGKARGQRPGELGPADVLALRRGYTVADAATLFDKSFRSKELIEIGCNMHARRYFAKALDAGDARAAPAIAAFKTLYEVEETARELTPQARCQERQARSKPVYEELVKWCKTYQPGEPPTSLLGRAVRYLLNHRVALMRFLEDGVIPIDNGIVERLHRGPAVGRRNYLFAGSHEGAQRAAIAYSVLGTCKLAGVNPIDYLTDVLPRLTRGVVIKDEVPSMLPAAWKRARTPP
jgi:transposase